METASLNLTAAITVLDVDECLALLRSNEVGRLAVASNSHPDIFPVNYVVDHGTVVFRTAEGTKLAAAVLGTAVASRSTAMTRRQVKPGVSC